LKKGNIQHSTSKLRKTFLEDKEPSPRNQSITIRQEESEDLVKDNDDKVKENQIKEMLKVFDEEK